jgi:RNA polymerase sigma factor (TIGR02999 family)
VAAQIMRRVLIDTARARLTGKRGGSFERVEHSTAMDFDAMPSRQTDRAAQLCSLDDALQALSQLDPRRAQVIELRFFGGLTVEETAEVLHVSPQTVMRDWRLARAWLTRELRR